MINLTHLYDRKLCIGCASNPGFLCWPRLYESSRWCTDKLVFRFKSWPLSVTRIIIGLLGLKCSKGVRLLPWQKRKVWRKEHVCQFWKVLIGWRKRGPDLFLTLTSDHCPPFNHFLLSKFLMLKYIAEIFALSVNFLNIYNCITKINSKCEIKTLNSE